MNSSRMNKLEELGRVDSEKAYTKKGKANLSDEKSRIVRELKAEGGEVGKKRKPQPSPGPKAGRPKAGRPSPQRKMGRGAQGSKKSNQPEVMIMRLKEEGPANKHKSLKLEKMKKITNSEGNIEFKRIEKANGGMVTVSGRGQGKVMPGRNKKTYIC